MLHVARLKGRREPVGFHQFVLGQALSLHLPAGPGEPRCAECGLVRTYERGSLRASQHIDDDEQLCEFLIEQTLRLPYPYGWKTDNSLNPDLNAGATRAGTWWSAHRALPYLESRRSDGAWEPPPE